VTFVSEPITPLPGATDTVAMVRGEPGLPPGFRWRDREYLVVERLNAGKTTGVDRGEVYVRRHTFTLKMDDGSRWEIYFLRQAARTKQGRGSGPRWFLKSTSTEADTFFQSR
jgi:Domain of unknown function (DUF6504)